ncbi:penicillin-binding protein 2 [Alicycliphilus sp. B1]|nr:penicillin-binding protein 2 [Alicycliphilus sp. B1]
MTELRNVEADTWRFRLRVFVLGVVVLLAFALIAARLVVLQVVRHEDLADQAESNRTAIVPIVPNRGLIIDRNGVVLATNYSAYTLEITPSRADGPGGDDRRAGPDRGHTAARPAPLQAPARGVAQLRLPAHTHAPDRPGGGALRGAALPLPRRGDQGAAVPQLPAG